MALRVACPNGCRLQVPKSRAGMMVRCPKCKKIIKLAELSAATKSVDGMDSIDAVFPTREELVELKRTVKQAADRSNLVRKSSAALQISKIQPEKPAAGQRIFQAVAIAPDLAGETTTELPREEIMFIEPTVAPTVEQPVEQEQHPPSKPRPEKRWRMPDEKREKPPAAEPAKLKARKPTETRTPPPASPRTTSSSTAQASPVAKSLRKSAARPAPPDTIDAKPAESAAKVKATEKSVATKTANAKNATAVATTTADEATKVKTVGVSHSKDAKSRAVFLTFALGLIAAFAIVPAARSFVGYVNTNGDTEIPRWASWLVFLGALHIVYAFYVAQLADWTSFRVVSVMMLILTAVMATLLAGMALGGQGGFVSQLFQIPMSLTTKAEIWLLTMLSITSLISFLSGREAFRWKKTENQLRAAISPGE